MTSTTRSRRLDAIGTGIHAQGATNAAGNAVIEMKARQSRLQRHGSKPLVRHSGTGAYAIAVDCFSRPKTFADKTNHETGNSAFAHQQV